MPASDIISHDKHIMVSYKSSTTTNQRRSRDARKVRKAGKGGKLLANGCLHHESFDAYGPLFLDDPNYIDEECIQSVQTELAFAPEAKHGFQLHAALVASMRDAVDRRATEARQEAKGISWCCTVEDQLQEVEKRKEAKKAAQLKDQG